MNKMTFLGVHYVTCLVDLNIDIWRFCAYNYLEVIKMDYMTIKDASDKWGLSVRRIQTLCREERYMEFNALVEHGQYQIIQNVQLIIE